MKRLVKFARNLVIAGIVFLPVWTVTPSGVHSTVEPTVHAAMNFIVTNNNDSGAGSLRQAIIDANANSGPDTISFNIPGTGVHVIALQSGLPPITSPVTIDGYTQPGALPNGSTLGDNAELRISLNGLNANSYGLLITAGSSTIRGLVINRFAGDGIELRTNGNNIIEGNFIGTNAQGTAALGNFNGITVRSNNNLIGGSTAASKNIISGSSFDGVRIASGTNNTVDGNLIGTDSTGIAPLGNLYFGVDCLSNGNIVGELVFGGNTIAFNREGVNVNYGVVGISILNNSIFGNYDLGISLGFGQVLNDVGDADTGPNELQNFPVLSGATSTGGTTSVTATLDSKPNTTFRITLFANAICDPSGYGQGQAVVVTTMVTTNSSGHAATALSFGQSIPTGPFLTATATDPSGNTSEFSPCIAATSKTFTVINTNDSGAGSLRQAIIDANGSAGTDLISFNIPGAGPRTITPTSPLPAITEGAIIDGYTQPGAKVNGSTIGDNAALMIELNGTNAGNGDGLVLQAGSSVVRGLVINRFNGNGVTISAPTGYDSISGNFIGLNPTGTTSLSNTANAVLINGSPFNVIGGLTNASRNVLSGSIFGGSAGVTIQNAGAANNLILGNYIGTDATGNAARPNASGIVLLAPERNRIGGFPIGARNLISGNNFDGIFTSVVSPVDLAHNFIGTNATGTLALGNGRCGVFLQADDSNVGGPSYGAGNGNTIAFNTAEGVRVSQGTGNFIEGNAIYSNGKLGIDLEPIGVTPNDAGDGDTGPNNLQNSPVITSANYDPTTDFVAASATLNSTPNTHFLISFYSSSSCDASGSGQGQAYLVALNLTTDGSGNGNVSGSIAFKVGLVGPVITATATRLNNLSKPIETSEFSSCRILTGQAGTFQFGNQSYSVVEGCTTANLTITRTGNTTVAASVDYATHDGVANQKGDYSVINRTVNFAVGESSKTVPVLISEDAYVEGNEPFTVTLTNTTAGFILGGPSTATLQITDNDTTNPPVIQPIDDARTFVGQHYHDFLARGADSGGLDYWTGQITQCGADQNCVRIKRIDVSNAFFYELEFQRTGAYVFRLYRAAYGNSQLDPNPDTSNPVEAKKIPSYDVFMADRSRITVGSTLAQSQLALANLLAAGYNFEFVYPSTMTGPEFVDAILANILAADGANLNSQRQALIDQFNSGGRGAVLYRLADDNEQGNPINNRAFIDAEYNRSFVFTQYAGYLRRNADIGGFLFWLGQVNGAPLRDVAKQHAMVCSFITSAEYQRRFSSVVTHTNSECPQ